MRNAKPVCFSCAREEALAGHSKFQGNTHPKPEESPLELLCIVHSVGSPYDFNEILSGFSSLLSESINLFTKYRIGELSITKISARN